MFPGTLCLCFGICISMVDLLYPHKFSTIMEMDYGTPFDRVTIIELSSEHKKRKKVRQPGQESPQSLFTGLIRRLSKREKGSASREVSRLTGGLRRVSDFPLLSPVSPFPVSRQLCF